MKKLWSTTVIGKDLTADTMFHFHQVAIYINTASHNVNIATNGRSYPSTCEGTTNVLKKKLLTLVPISIVSDLETQKANSAIYRKPR